MSIVSRLMVQNKPDAQLDEAGAGEELTALSGKMPPAKKVDRSRAVHLGGSSPQGLCRFLWRDWGVDCFM